MPKVSVIVPNYNHADFLNQRMESIFLQTFKDYEIILLDDCSTDDSNSILEEYSKKPFVSKFIRNEKNTGSPFAQWNKGVSLATGEYIWIAESDDYADNELLKSLVDLLNNNPKAGVAYCQSKSVDIHGNEISTLRNWTDDIDSELWKSDFKGLSTADRVGFLAQKCIIPNASAVLIRKSIYTQVGNADEDFVMSGDWMLWSKIALVSDIAYLAKPMNYFRVHDNSVRKKSDRTLISIMESIRIFKYIDEHGELSTISRNKAIDNIFEKLIISLSNSKVDLPNKYKIIMKYIELDTLWKRRTMSRLLASLHKSMSKLWS